MALSASRLFAIACLGVVVAATPAQAVRYRDTSAGGACHAANGGASARFVRGNFTLTNIGTDDQYVVCHLQMDDDGTEAPLTPQTVSVSMTAGATLGTPVCLAQTGYHAQGANHVRSSFSRSIELPPGNSAFLAWTASTTWSRLYYYETLVINCKVPPGFKMGLIEWVQ